MLIFFGLCDSCVWGLGGWYVTHKSIGSLNLYGGRVGFNINITNIENQGFKQDCIFPKEMRNFSFSGP
jgi:hypothetical protein